MRGVTYRSLRGAGRLSGSSRPRFGRPSLASRLSRAAVAAAKRGGRKRGTAGSVETAARARAARSEQANKANATTRAVIAEIQRAGKTTLAAIAQELEGRGVRHPAGADPWAPGQVAPRPGGKR